MKGLCTAVSIAQEDLRQRLVHNLEFLGENVSIVSDAEFSDRELEGDIGLVISSGENLRPVKSHIPLITIGDSDRQPEGAENNHIAHLELPLRDYHLVEALNRAASFRDQQAFNWPTTDKFKPDFLQLIGDSAPMQTVKELMGKVCAREATVLLTGASGTGKEVVARSIHDASPRAQAPFVPVNCGAIPPDLIESELFGYEKGAFTGAVSRKLGRFELARGGTIFLDEVGDLPLMLQVKLLRVIQERTFERVGGTETIQSDVRIISATHQDLESMIAAGSFREDLYYRLNLFPIHLPLLRERGDDLALLVRKFQIDIEKSTGDVTRLGEDAMHELEKYAWPGNVRELRNLIERMTIQYPNTLLQAEQLPEKIRSTTNAENLVLDKTNRQDALHNSDGGRSIKTTVNVYESAPLLPINGLDLKEYMSSLEKSLIQQALDDTESIVARAADRLHIRRTTLVEKMRKYGMQRVVTH